MSNKPKNDIPARFARFPWSDKAKKYIRENQLLNIESLRKKVNKTIVQYGKERVINAINNVNFSKKDLKISNILIELVSFPLAKAFVSDFKDKRLVHRFATYESKKAGIFLNQEIEDDRLISLSNDTFGWDTKKSKERIEGRATQLKKNFDLHFRYYLQVAPSFHDRKWKLINKVLKNGRILITKKEFNRILEEAVKNQIINTIKKKANLEDIFPEEIEEIRESWNDYKSEYEEETMGETIVNAFPPCISKILEKISSGKGASHIERFTIASFLLKLNWTVNKVISIFNTTPDFREDLARYQIEHIAKGAEDGTGYSPPGCEYLKTNQICYENNYCRRWKIKHPLSYYRFALRLPENLDEMNKMKKEKGGK
ncbi:MAG: hypothetical protein ACTSUV_02240 [Candidatus Ranarchaeia archaeon]